MRAPSEQIQAECITNLYRAAREIGRVWPMARADAEARVLPKARAYDSAGGGQSAGENVDGESIRFTPVERIAFTPNRAVAWLAELGDVLAMWGVSSPTSGTIAVLALRVEFERLECPDPTAKPVVRLYRLADNGTHWWPRPERPTGTRKSDATIDNTLADRWNNVENCGYCQQPAPGGRDEQGRLLIRRIDGVPYHNVTLVTRLGEPSQPACYWVVWRSRHESA
jgi:hypothetical protein